MSREGRKHVDRSPVSRHSMQSYILTNHRLTKREPLIALGKLSPGRGGVGGGLNLYIPGTPPWGHKKEPHQFVDKGRLDREEQTVVIKLASTPVSHR